jgi:hypothetical protein
MEVTARNFREVLPEIEAAISRASFIAMDCEMSGLGTEPALRTTHFDTLDSRWARVRASCRDMALLQLGICPFEWSEAEGA